MFAVARWCRTVFLTTLLVPLAVSAFTFTNTNPSQCDDLTIKWTGGQPPFNLLMIPPGQILRNISIPSSAFTNNAEKFTTQLALAQSQHVIFALSDSTGVTAGGISAVFEVGPSTSGSQCDVKNPIPDFFFSTDEELTQCQPFPFTQYPNAIQPVTIIGFVPQGPSLVFHPPIAPSFSWNPVNLTAGTSIVFYMTDAQGRNGGTGQVDVVAQSSDQSCLSAALSESSSSESQPGTPLQPGAASLKSHAPLVAGVLASVAALILVLAFALFYIRRRRRSQKPSGRSRARKLIDSVYSHARSPASETASYVMIPATSTSTPPSEAESMTAHARKQQMILEYRAGQSMTPYPPSTSETPSYFDTSGQSTLSGYSSLADSDPPSQYKSPPRLIVHTDIAESGAEPLEIPPQYSEGRVPIPGMVTSEGQDITLSQSTAASLGKAFTGL